MDTIEEIDRRLDAKIPESAVETREQAGRSLSYLSGAYVINRLNEVLGHGKWGYSVQRLERVFEGRVQQRSGEVFATSYIATVKLWAKLDGRESSYEDVGYGDGTDRTNPGKAHELAVKEAVTDGIKRAAKNLGRSMGLGLYFKDNQYIASEEEIQAQKAQEEAAAAPAQASKKGRRRGGGQEQSPATGPLETPAGRGAAGAGAEAGAEGASKRGASNIPEPPLNKGQREGTKDMIRAVYRILRDQSEITPEDFKNRYLQGKRMDELSDDALVGAYKKLTQDYQQLLT